MATKKYVYIAVVNEGDKIRLVTKIDTHRCFWNEGEKPLKVTQANAVDYVYGLNLNGYRAFVLTSLWEVDEQFAGWEK